MKVRILIALSLGVATALIPAGAVAKGVNQVTISGPDLAKPVSLGPEGVGYLAQAAGLFSACFDTGPAPADPRQPWEDLGKQYIATYTYDFPENGTERLGRVRQELYPFAAGGAVTYTPPGQKLFNRTCRDTWHRDTRLAPMLIAAGLPAPASAAPQPVSSAVEATPRLTG